MLKKFLLPICFIAYSATSFGQSTLTGANFNPVQGDAFSVRICDTTGILPGLSGGSITWDFSTTLVPMSYDTGRCIYKPYGYGASNFPLANIAVKGPTFWSHSTTYYRGNADSLCQDGYYSAIDTNLILSDPAEQIRYPFTYGTTFSDAYSGIMRLGPVSAHHNGTINVTCDGWGTLKLPGGIIHSSVLRVHTTQTFTDSTNIFGSPVLKTYNISSYDWYKPDYHTALLTIQSVFEVGNPNPTFRIVAYADVKFNAVADINKKLTSLQLSPNPATDVLNIKFTSTDNEQIRISLQDAMGREVALISDKQVKGPQQFSYNAKNLARGIYFVRLQTAEGEISRKVVLQ